MRPQDRLRTWARKAKTDILALGLAMRDPRVPWYAKLLAAGIVGYALSPIDLIPDFIPIVGYLDDLLLVPLGIILVVKMIPPDLMDELRDRAATVSKLPGSGRRAALVVLLLWAAFAIAAVGAAVSMLAL